MIVPCYKVEQYLPKCLDSIVNQSYKYLEIILVDDGSPDRCGEICDEYAKRDERIRVIHKENGGLSDARNVALDVMTGEYVTFIDSDDFVARDYVESLYRQAEETDADIVVTQWLTFYEGEEPKVKPHYDIHRKVFTREQAMVSMMYQKDFDTAACLKLYRSELFREQRFPKGFISEDLATVYLLIMKSKTVAWNDYPCYYYMLRKSSIEGAGFNPRKYDSYIKIAAQLERDKARMTQAERRAVNCRIVSLMFHLLLDMPDTEPEKKERLMSIVRKYRSGVLLDFRARWKARVACLLSYFGLNALAKARAKAQAMNMSMFRNNGTTLQGGNNA